MNRLDLDFSVGLLIEHHMDERFLRWGWGRQGVLRWKRNSAAHSCMAPSECSGFHMISFFFNPILWKVAITEDLRQGMLRAQWYNCGRPVWEAPTQGRPSSSVGAVFCPPVCFRPLIAVPGFFSLRNPVSLLSVDVDHALLFSEAIVLQRQFPER